MPSDTPRTDAAAMAWKNHQDGRGCSMWRTPYGGVVFAEFARELERELVSKTDELAAAIKQRDEARREVCVKEKVYNYEYGYKPTDERLIAAERGWDCFKEWGGA